MVYKKGRQNIKFYQNWSLKCNFNKTEAMILKKGENKEKE
jgi:hypothetical protein